MRLITANVNGVRAAARKNGIAQLRDLTPDVVTLQEVRATSVQLAQVLAGEGLLEWSVVHAECDLPGRNGVAVLSPAPIVSVDTGLPGFDEDGRWIEATTTAGGRRLTVVSAYVPKGHVGEPAQDRKMRFLAAATVRLRELIATDADTVVTGDLNIARTEADIKNWKQRVGKSGFMPEERAYLDSWQEQGWVDLGRQLGGPGPGPYTWWSQRGRAFDNDSGWRIDYVWATPHLAARATAVQVARAGSWDARWSDHAPVVVDFD